jgi:hypothetical protein
MRSRVEEEARIEVASLDNHNQEDKTSSNYD